MSYSHIDVFPVTRGVTFEWRGYGFAKILNKPFSCVPQRQAFTHPMTWKNAWRIQPSSTNSLAQAADQPPLRNNLMTWRLWGFVPFAGCNRRSDPAAPLLQITDR